jgi:hypothetical protein
VSIAAYVIVAYITGKESQVEVLGSEYDRSQEGNKTLAALLFGPGSRGAHYQTRSRRIL